MDRAPDTARTAVQRIRQFLPAALAPALPAARWYADKDRVLTGIEIHDAVADRWRAGVIVWLIAEMRFAQGEPSRYAVATALPPGDLEPDADADHWRSDGVADSAFPEWFLTRLRTGARLAGERGSLAFEPLPGLAERLDAAESLAAQVGGAEQSNTNIRYDTALLAKLFRRLRPGPNPDLEITRFLAERTGFRNAPRPLGAVRYLPRDGEPTVVAIVQEFLANDGDGWEWTLRALAEAFDGGAAAAPHGINAALALLGLRTAELHLALASDPAAPAFASEPLSEAAIDATIAAALANLAATMIALRDRQVDAPPELRAAIEEALAAEPALAERLRGMAAERGSAAIRVHGDYHLGQTLRTPEGDWIVLDFEGEPGRTLEERRRKTSALKDVSGMLRSFGYARAAAEREHPGAAAALAAWEEDARRAFLDAYLDVARNAEPPLLPRDEVGFRRALDAWEIDKALYEVRYEVANRPDWLATPLRALRPPTG